MKSWFSGIFGYFFTRVVIAILTFAVILLIILLPFFKTQLLQMVESQGQTFSNSTIAATTSSLYTGSYGEVVEYITRVLKVTNNILFVVITKSDAIDIVITKDNWYQTNEFLKNVKINFGKNKKLLHFESSSSPVKNNFIYQQPIEIGGAPWGFLSIGISDSQYLFIKNRYMLIVVSTSITLVLVLSLLFYRSSKNIRFEMSNLSDTGQQLQIGNLNARAFEGGTGEIGFLSKAINTMAVNLQEQSKNNNQLAQIVKQTNDAFILFDSSLNIIFVNDATTDVTGFPAEQFNGMTMIGLTSLLNLDLSKILHELDWIVVNKQDSQTRDVVITKNNQSKTDVELRLETISNNLDSDQNQDQNFLLVMSNITTRKHLEKELHQLAFYDKLTDLPNRRMFMDHLRYVIKNSRRHKKSFALFFIDLDNFKFINDTLGHEAGDEFLVMIGNKLKEIFRDADMVTRLGGDEFTILIEDIKDHSNIDIAKLAEKLVNELASSSIYISGRSLAISTSLGVALYPENGTDSDILLRNADIAMYSAKKAGKNRYAFFSEEMNATLRKRIAIENDLKQAIESKIGIDYYYQPIINLANNQLEGAEALARWHHPTKGFISPEEFIPIAESTDLIIALSNYLLGIAFKQANAWRSLGFTPYLSVNISGRQFDENNFIDTLVRALDTHNVSACNIQLEFTESIMLDSTDKTISKFEELKRMGFKIAIDDFGTGYSSLAYIHKLPIDVIKIDRSFVNGIIDNKKTSSIVAAITKLSNVLDIKTIAEGIEFEEHANILRHLKCDYGQGYLFDKALPKNEFEEKYLTNYIDREPITYTPDVAHFDLTKY